VRDVLDADSSARAAAADAAERIEGARTGVAR
jgi:hypothetical protein